MHHRLEQGRELPLTVRCVDASGTPLVPDQPPAVLVYDAAGTKLLSALMWPLDRYRAAGVFRRLLFLGTSYPAGYYRVAFAWSKDGVSYLRCGHFTVLPGGDARGALVSAHFLERPWANFVVTRADDGTAGLNRNPYV